MEGNVEEEDVPAGPTFLTGLGGSPRKSESTSHGHRYVEIISKSMPYKLRYYSKLINKIELTLSSWCVLFFNITVLRCIKRSFVLSNLFKLDYATMRVIMC